MKTGIDERFRSDPAKNRDQRQCHIEIYTDQITPPSMM